MAVNNSRQSRAAYALFSRGAFVMVAMISVAVGACTVESVDLDERLAEEAGVLRAVIDRTVGAEATRPQFLVLLQERHARIGDQHLDAAERWLADSFPNVPRDLITDLRRAGVRPVFRQRLVRAPSAKRRDVEHSRVEAAVGDLTILRAIPPHSPDASGAAYLNRVTRGEAMMAAHSHERSHGKALCRAIRVFPRASR